MGVSIGNEVLALAGSWGRVLGPSKRDETADVSMVGTRLNAGECTTLGGCNGGAQRPPCQDCGTTPHILRFAKLSICRGP